MTAPDKRTYNTDLTPPPDKISMTVHPDVWENSRRAYMADYIDNLGPDGDLANIPATSHSHWIEQAITTHATLPISQRTTTERNLPDLPPAKRIIRNPRIPTDVLSALNNALTAEANDGHPLRNRARFIEAALRTRIETVRARRGGNLPLAPDRLPVQRRPRS